MAGSAFYIYYLHELRGYTLHVLLGCGALSLYWSLLHSTTYPRLKQVGFTIVKAMSLIRRPPRANAGAPSQRANPMRVLTVSRGGVEKIHDEGARPP